MERAGKLLTTRVAAAIAIAVVPGLAWTACFSDLEDPVACPPAARVALSGQCMPQSPAPPCLAPPSFQCFGKASDCGCSSVSNECPPPANACFPNGNCPTAVTSAVDAGVTCYELTDSLTYPIACAGCGCVGCLQVCDGVGPALGALLPTPPSPDGGVAAVPIFSAKLPSQLPVQGRLGVYVRARGMANAAIAAGGIPGAGAQQIETVNQSAFTEQVLPNVYAWSQEAFVPLAVEIDALPGNPTLMEVDCIIPFVVDEAP